MTKHIVYIVDDDVELCRSLEWLLASVDLQIKIFNSSVEFINNYKPEPYIGCILLDIRMPEMTGLELQEQLNTRHNTLPIIFMTGHGDVPMAVRAMQAGAFNFLTKPFNDQVLLEQIYKAIAHHQKLYLLNQKNDSLQKRFNSLTARELEVLKLIIKGKLNKEIAGELNISIKTIELHRTHIMKKMEAATIAELVKFYMILVNNKSLSIQE